MTSPPGLDLLALQGYLDRVGIATSGPLSAELISGGRSNLTYTVTDGQRAWVLRRPPLGQILPGAHDVAREYRIMAALAGSSVPVPSMTALCLDPEVLGLPFYLMDRIDGVVLRSRELVSGVEEPVRRQLSHQLVDTLADLHDVDYTAVGLGDLGRPEGYLQRQLDRWVRQYQKVKIRELDHVDEIVSALQSAMPRSPRPAIVHGDYRIDNVILRRDQHTGQASATIAGVLDWELATLGDPLADLATLVMFWDEIGKPWNPITAGLTAFAGFSSAADVIERYLSRRGQQVADIDWYLVFAQFKLAIILEQMHARYVAGDTVGAGFDDVGAMVIFLLDKASSDLHGSASLGRPGTMRYD
ncbi:MAG: phosphotransferase family protein [Frankiales bacterium]|nr:phosphotransferase family protein [Frankiales bacterium]